MPAPASCISYGAGTLYTKRRVRRRRDGFHTGDFEALSASEFDFVQGMALPGYTGLYVAEVDSERDGPQYRHTISALGLYGVASQKIASTAEDSEEGFDTGTERWIVSAGTSFTYGRAHSLHGNLRCVNITDEESPISAYKYINLSFKGIKNGNKPIRRKVDTLTREVTRQNFLITLSGGDANPHNWSILLSSPTLQISYLATSRPDTTRVGLPANVADFPARSGYDFSAQDDTLTWSFPNGVVLGALSYEEVPGTTICFVTEIFVDRQKINLG